MTDTSQIKKELFIAMIEQLINNFPHYKDSHYNNETLCNHMFISAWETLCDLLWSLGLAESVTLRDGEIIIQDVPRGPMFRLIIISETLRDLIEEQYHKDVTNIDTVLYVWLNYFSAYSIKEPEGDTIPTTRKAFSPYTDYKPILLLLSKLGYVAQENDMFVWTDKIAPVMQQFYQWNKQLEDARDINEAQLQRQCSMAMQTIPPDHLTYVKTHKNIVAITQLIFHYWDGERWSNTKLEKQIINFGSAKEIAQFLIDHT